MYLKTRETKKNTRKNSRVKQLLQTRILAGIPDAYSKCCFSASSPMFNYMTTVPELTRSARTNFSRCSNIYSWHTPLVSRAGVFRPVVESTTPRERSSRSGIKPLFSDTSAVSARRGHYNYVFRQCSKQSDSDIINCRNYETPQTHNVYAVHGHDRVAHNALHTCKLQRYPHRL